MNSVLVKENSEKPALSRGEYRSLAFLLASLSAIGPFSIDTYLPSFLEIGARLGTSQLAVQQTLTAYLTPFAIMTLWHGAISDALGRRRVVLSCMALFAVASIGCAASRTIEALWLFRGMQGLTAGAGMVVGRAIIRDLFSGEEAHRLMAHVSIMFAIAPAIAPVIGGQLHAWFGWRSVFIFLAMFSSGLWLWCLLRLPETLDRKHRQSLHPVYLARSYRKVLTRGSFVAICAAGSLNFGAFFIYVASAPVFLLKHLKVKETEFFWLFGPATAGMMLGSWLSSRLASHSHQKTIRLGFLIMGGAAFFNVVMNCLMPARVPWAVVPLFFYNLGMTAIMPSLTLLGLDLFPTQRGLAASCQGFIQTATNSLTAAIVAPLVCSTPLMLASGQLAYVFTGLLATVAFFLLEGSAAKTNPVEARTG